jgi:hypothetical protein
MSAVSSAKSSDDARDHSQAQADVDASVAGESVQKGEKEDGEQNAEEEKNEAPHPDVLELLAEKIWQAAAKRWSGGIEPNPAEHASLIEGWARFQCQLMQGFDVEWERRSGGTWELEWVYNGKGVEHPFAVAQCAVMKRKEAAIREVQVAKQLKEKAVLEKKQQLVMEQLVKKLEKADGCGLEKTVINLNDAEMRLQLKMRENGKMWERFPNIESIHLMKHYYGNTLPSEDKRLQRNYIETQYEGKLTRVLAYWYMVVWKDRVLVKQSSCTIC